MKTSHERMLYEPRSRGLSPKEKAGLAGMAAVAAVASLYALQATNIDPADLAKKAEVSRLESGEPLNYSSQLLIIREGTNLRESPDMVDADSNNGTADNIARTVKKGETLVVTKPIVDGDWVGFTIDAKTDMTADVKDVANNLVWVNVNAIEKDPTTRDKIQVITDTTTQGNGFAEVYQGHLVDQKAPENPIAEAKIMDVDQAEFLVRAIDAGTGHTPK